MYLGKVVGCVWSTVKSPAFVGLRMLVVQPLSPDLKPTGKQLICTDATGAGAGEIVYWVRGREATLPFAPAEPPTDTTIVGIVDSVHLGSAAEGGGGTATAPEAARAPRGRPKRPARKDTAC